MSLSPVDTPSESYQFPSSSASGYHRGTRMSLSPPNPSRQLESPDAESFNQAFTICGIKVAEIDEQDVENKGVDVFKVLGVYVAEKEKREVYCRRRASENEGIGMLRPRSCVEEGWVFLNCASLVIGWFSFDVVALECFKIYKFHHAAIAVCNGFVLLGLALLLAFTQKRCRGMPFRLIGRVGRIIADIIALVAAFILREALPYSGSESSLYALVFLVNLTLNLHSWLKVLRRTDDISFGDVLLEVIVQAAIYISTGHDIVCIFIVLFFCGLMYHKYTSYSTPITLEDKKKDLESLPV